MKEASGQEFALAPAFISCLSRDSRFGPILSTFQPGDWRQDGLTADAVHSQPVTRLALAIPAPLTSYPPRSLSLVTTHCRDTSTSVDPPPPGGPLDYVGCYASRPMRAIGWRDRIRVK